MGIPDLLTCLLRNLYAGQEATVRTLYGTTDWFKTKKGIQHGYLLSPCLFNLYAEHIMRNVGLDELQAGIKIGRRNINNLRYAYQIRSVAQSYPTLCDPMDCSLSGFSVHGILHGKNTGVGYHFLLQGIFPTQESNLSLLIGRQILYH